MLAETLADPRPLWLQRMCQAIINRPSSGSNEAIPAKVTRSLDFYAGENGVPVANLQGYFPDAILDHFKQHPLNQASPTLLAKLHAAVGIEATELANHLFRSPVLSGHALYLQQDYDQETAEYYLNCYQWYINLFTLVHANCLTEEYMPHFVNALKTAKYNPCTSIEENFTTQCLLQRMIVMGLSLSTANTGILPADQNRRYLLGLEESLVENLLSPMFNDPHAIAFLEAQLRALVQRQFKAFPLAVRVGIDRMQQELIDSLKAKPLTLFETKPILDRSIAEIQTTLSSDSAKAELAAAANALWLEFSAIADIVSDDIAANVDARLVFMEQRLAAEQELLQKSLEADQRLWEIETTDIHHLAHVQGRAITGFLLGNTDADPRRFASKARKEQLETQLMQALAAGNYVAAIEQAIILADNNQGVLTRIIASGGIDAPMLLRDTRFCDDLLRIKHAQLNPLDSDFQHYAAQAFSLIAATAAIPRVDTTGLPPVAQAIYQRLATLNQLLAVGAIKELEFQQLASATIDLMVEEQLLPRAQSTDRTTTRDTLYAAASRITLPECKTVTLARIAIGCDQVCETQKHLLVPGNQKTVSYPCLDIVHSQSVTGAEGHIVGSQQLHLFAQNAPDVATALIAHLQPAPDSSEWQTTLANQGLAHSTAPFSPTEIVAPAPEKLAKTKQRLLQLTSTAAPTPVIATVPHTALLAASEKQAQTMANWLGNAELQVDPETIPSTARAAQLNHAVDQALAQGNLIDAAFLLYDLQDNNNGIFSTTVNDAGMPTCLRDTRFAAQLKADPRTGLATADARWQNYAVIGLTYIQATKNFLRTQTTLSQADERALNELSHTLVERMAILDKLFSSKKLIFNNNAELELAKLVNEALVPFVSARAPAYAVPAAEVLASSKQQKKAAKARNKAVRKELEAARDLINFSRNPHAIATLSRMTVLDDFVSREQVQRSLVIDNLLAPAQRHVVDGLEIDTPIKLPAWFIKKYYTDLDNQPWLSLLSTTKQALIKQHRVDIFTSGIIPTQLRDCLPGFRNMYRKEVYMLGRDPTLAYDVSQAWHSGTSAHLFKCKDKKVIAGLKEQAAIEATRLEIDIRQAKEGNAGAEKLFELQQQYQYALARKKNPVKAINQQLTFDALAAQQGVTNCDYLFILSLLSPGKVIPGTNGKLLKQIAKAAKARATVDKLNVSQNPIIRLAQPKVKPATILLDHANKVFKRYTGRDDFNVLIANNKHGFTQQRLDQIAQQFSQTLSVDQKHHLCQLLQITSLYSHFQQGSSLFESENSNLELAEQLKRLASSLHALDPEVVYAIVSQCQSGKDRDGVLSFKTLLTDFTSYITGIAKPYVAIPNLLDKAIKAGYWLLLVSAVAISLALIVGTTALLVSAPIPLLLTLPGLMNFFAAISSVHVGWLLLGGSTAATLDLLINDRSKIAMACIAVIALVGLGLLTVGIAPLVSIGLWLTHSYIACGALALLAGVSLFVTAVRSGVSQLKNSSSPLLARTAVDEQFEQVTAGQHSANVLRQPKELGGTLGNEGVKDDSELMISRGLTRLFKHLGLELIKPTAKYNKKLAKSDTKCSTAINPDQYSSWSTTYTQAAVTTRIPMANLPHLLVQRVPTMTKHSSSTVNALLLDQRISSRSPSSITNGFGVFDPTRQPQSGPGSASLKRSHSFTEATTTFPTRVVS